MSSSIDADVRALYREPLAGFIAARDALVKTLQTDGRTDDAARVKALRKPSAAAWGLDQLADRDPSGIQSLLDAGAEVRAAQQAAISSDRHADRLRDATAARRRAVDALAAEAAAALADGGHAAASHEADIRATLEAASIDPDAGERLRAGTLEKPITDAVGFGDMFGLRGVPDATDDDDEAEEPSAKTPSKGELGRARRDRDAAVRKADQAREAATRLAEQVGAMEARLEEHRGKHAAAETKALEAELEAKRAEDALRTLTDRT